MRIPDEYLRQILLRRIEPLKIRKEYSFICHYNMKKTVRPFMALNVRIAKSVSCFFAAGMQGSVSSTFVSGKLKYV